MKSRWLIGLAAVSASFTLAAQTQLQNGLLVIVDQDVITHKDLMVYIAPAIEVLARTYPNQPDLLKQRVQEAQRDGLDQLVERKLILHEFERNNYHLPETLIDDRVRDRIRERFGGDRAALTKTLQSQGMTYEAYRKRIREDFILGIMRSRNIGQEVIISPGKIEKYYAENLNEFRMKDQVKLRAIMIGSKPRRTLEDAQKLAREIEAKLEEGASFAEMASVYSDDTYRPQGGDRGWVERTALAKELADAAFALKPGQRSAPILLGDAWWIVLVEDVKSNHIQTLMEVRDTIEKRLQAQEQARLNKQWIDSLRKKSFVRYFAS
jgi:peptidyl-prolyl cis-trans isomerase SurA